MSANFYDLLKYAATGQASPGMTYYDRMRAPMLMGGAVQTLTGIPPLSFKANGKPLISWSMKGNGQQSGTPTPNAPIMPEFVGTLDDSDWTITITCAGQTVPVYLGQTQTLRRIKKLVLTGEEVVYKYTNADIAFRINTSDAMISYRYCACTHLTYQRSPGQSTIDGVTAGAGDKNLYFTFSTSSAAAAGIVAGDVNSFKFYLAAQYAAGTPMTVWYVLEEPETTIVNEPLCKIGDYADELHSTDAGVTIPTVKGSNTLTVESELQPSEMTITFKG